MNQEVIKLENLYKTFNLNWRTRRGHFTFFNNLFSTDKLIALNNINLSIKEGENLGIIGKNGVGKTILLKIISGIIQPTSGTIIVRKNVSPIFGYGAGFRNELSGLENIFLYGSLLRIKRKTVSKNLNEIIEFSELGDFINVKLGYYSAGMRMRLAFSVISILEPEILIMDDSLVVGDGSFVIKARKKLNDLKRNNVTLLLTSHSLSLLKDFCKSGIVMHEGKIVYSDSIESAISFYKENILQIKEQELIRTT